MARAPAAAVALKKVAAPAQRLVEVGRPAQALKVLTASLENVVSPERFAYQTSFANFVLGNTRAAFFGLHFRSLFDATMPSGGGLWFGKPEADAVVWAPAGIGIGAEVLYAGFLPKLKDLFPAFTLMCDARLAPVLRRSIAGLRVEPRPAATPQLGKPLCSILSLGHIANLHAGSSGRGGRFIGVSRKTVQGLRERYGQPGKLLVGLSWKTINSRASWRNLPDLARLVRHLLKQNVVPVSLQHGLTEIEKAAVRRIGIVIDDSIDPETDFSGLVDQIAAMDVVLTIPNTVAHVSGALRKRVIVLRADRVPWEWRAQHAETFWYESVRFADMRDAYQIEIGRSSFA